MAVVGGFFNMENLKIRTSKRKAKFFLGKRHKPSEILPKARKGIKRLS